MNSSSGEPPDPQELADRREAKTGVDQMLEHARAMVTYDALVTSQAEVIRLRRELDQLRAAAAESDPVPDPVVP